MKTLKLLLLSCVTLLSVDAMAKSPKAEKLLMCGSGWKKVAIVDKETNNIEWEYPLEKGWETNSAVMLKNGNVIFSYKKGARAVNAEKEIVWDFKCPNGSELQSVSLLKNGNALLSWCGHPLTIVEVDANSGEVISKAEYETGIENPHAQMRQVIGGDKGTYILPLLALKQLHIISSEGELIRKVDVKGAPFTVEKMKKDIYMVAGGDSHLLEMINIRTGESLKTYESTDIEGTSLFFVAGLAKTKKQGLYICNWQGHSKGAVGPQLIEINKKGEMVWSIDDNKTFGRISDIYPFK